jgi:hypothetical protein
MISKKVMLMSSQLIQSDCAGKLSKLILLLSSNVDGEVLAAARAIGRTLESEGCDWHDLADIVVRPLPSPIFSPPEWRQAVAECLRWPELLSPKELGFLTTVRRQAKLTPKQGDWLDAIIERVRS